MSKNNIVIFKGGKDGITILLDGAAGFDEIERAMAEKIQAASKFFGDEKTSLIFKGRELNEEEEQSLIDIIIRGSDLDILFSDTRGVRSYAAAPRQAQPAPQPLSEADSAAHFHNGSLRSGQTIRYAGSVIVIGDINPGAEIVAEGNIMIMGALKGMVHAGCGGKRDSFVSALNMQPIQLRIADVITYIPPEMLGEGKNRLNPVYAYIREGQIYIAPLYDADRA